MSEATDITARIQRIEDIEAIRRLKYRYCGLCDNGFQADEIAALFTEDGVWVAGEPWGDFEGREAIAGFFRTMPDSVSFSVHALSNGEIDVDGNTAHARWRTLIPTTLKQEGGGVPHWMFCDYEDELRKEAGQWLFTRITADVTRSASHADGWD